MSVVPGSAITRATDAGGRPCVFKQLRPEHRHREDLLVRLRNEQQVLAHLANVPGVIRLLDVRGDPLTLILELADGGSLSDQLAEPRLTNDAREQIARDLLAGVAACHARGVIHRDLKPSNILFVGDSLRLADFGVAAWGDPPRALPDGWDEDDVGTPPWSAPELRHDASHHTSPAADVYGVAMLLRELLPDAASEELSAALRDDPRQRPPLSELARMFR